MSLVIANESQALKSERVWLFKHVLPRAIDPIKEGLRECSELLRNASITLPITSRETESLKGIMTRQGSQLVKGDLMVKMHRLQLRLTISPQHKIHLQQIEDVGSLVHYSIESLEHELYEDTAGRIVKDVSLNINQALQALSHHPSTAIFPLSSQDTDALQPEVPHNVALDLYIQDAALVAEIRTLQPRRQENLFTSLRKASVSETGGFVRYRGEDVRVIEHVRVESQDPALIAVLAKLTALKHNIEEVQTKLTLTSSSSSSSNSS